MTTEKIKEWEDRIYGPNTTHELLEVVAYLLLELVEAFEKKKK